MNEKFWSKIRFFDWNIRGLKDKILNIKHALPEKDVDICAIQKTKLDDSEDVGANYIFLLQQREIQHNGLGFAMNPNLSQIRKKMVTESHASAPHISRSAKYVTDFYRALGKTVSSLKGHRSPLHSGRRVQRKTWKIIQRQKVGKLQQ